MDIPSADLATALYYEFSTIAQTLAGLAGFLGAFLLFRFSELSRSIQDNIGRIHSNVLESREDQEELKLFHEGNAEPYLKYVEKEGLLKEIAKTLYLPTARKLLHWKTDLLGKLCHSLGPPGVTIITAVLVLGTTPLISRCISLTWFLLLSGLLATGYSVIAMFGLFREATK